MASKSEDKDGNVTIQFVLAGKRKSIWLGKVTKRDVGLWTRHVEELVSAKKIGRTPYDETAEWIANLDDELHRKLSGKAGLAEPRQQRHSADELGATLAAFLDAFIAKQTDKKPSTIVCLTQCRNDLVEFFGADRALVDVTEGDAEDWRHWLRKRAARPGRQKSPTARQSRASHRDRNKPKQPPKVLQENTIRRRCGRARQLFQAVVRHRLITRNPFSELKGVSVLANRTRDCFIERDVADKVIEACPDSQWKLLFALSRYGGLRCPSEHLGLRWSDIDWKRGRIVVRSPKTEHHDGKESRVMPLFPELRPYLEAVRDEMKPGKETPLNAPIITRYRESNVNLRTQLLRIMTGAGVPAWPKLFQNLRASRATELERDFGGKCAAAWIGHSITVAQKHYWQVTDADFERATGNPINLHHPMHTGAETRSKQAQRKTRTTTNHGKRDKCSPFAIKSMAEAGVEPARELPPNGF
jgi:integrase